MLKDFLSPFSNLNLPASEKKVFQRQYIETKISSSSESDFDFKSIIPGEGYVSWIIGSELDRIPAAMLKGATYAALQRRPDEVQFIDINNHSEKGRTCYRSDFIASKYIGIPGRSDIEEATQRLNKNLDQWSLVYEALKKLSKKVTFYKYPNHKIISKNTLLVSMNPRRGVLYHLNGKLGQQGNAAIICDMEMDNVIALGSRLHFHMNNEPYVVEAYRQILSKTQHVTEQRAIFLEPTSRLINLVRTANTKDSAQALLSVDVPIKAVIARFASELTKTTWVDAAKASSLLLSDSERLLLIEKAERLDSSYEKALTKMFGNGMDCQLSVAREIYTNSILEAYKRDRHEILETYQREFGQLSEGFNEISFVISCAEKDWDQNSKSLDFVFPEYGVKSLNKDIGLPTTQTNKATFSPM